MGPFLPLTASCSWAHTYVDTLKIKAANARKERIGKSCRRGDEIRAFDLYLLGSADASKSLSW